MRASYKRVKSARISKEILRKRITSTQLQWLETELEHQFMINNGVIEQFKHLIFAFYIEQSNLM